MTLARPHRPRTSTPIEDHLRAWADAVRRAERGEPDYESDCPCCNGDQGRESRDRLEAVIRRGGKRGRRVWARVRPLDERYEKATYPLVHAARPGGWWWQRHW